MGNVLVPEVIAGIGVPSRKRCRGMNASSKDRHASRTSDMWTHHSERSRPAVDWKPTNPDPNQTREWMSFRLPGASTN